MWFAGGVDPRPGEASDSAAVGEAWSNQEILRDLHGTGWHDGQRKAENADHRNARATTNQKRLSFVFIVPKKLPYVNKKKKKLCSEITDSDDDDDAVLLLIYIFTNLVNFKTLLKFFFFFSHVFNNLKDKIIHLFFVQLIYNRARLACTRINFSFKALKKKDIVKN